MKHAYKQFAVAGLLAVLGVVSIAQTPLATPGTAPSTAVVRDGHGRADPAKLQERMARMQQRMARQLSAFKQKLQLSPGQEAAWTSYTEALKPTQRSRSSRAEFAALSTPERIDRMRANRVARMAEMDKRGDATKTFYAVLSPDQKKVFDKETVRHSRHGGGRHHGRHHRS